MHHQIPFSSSFRLTPGALGVGLVLGGMLVLSTAGCDTAEPVGASRDAELIVEVLEDEAGPGSTTSVVGEVVATLDLPEGGTLTFVWAGDDSIALAADVNGESGARLDQLMKMNDPTPLELFLNYAPDQEPPEALAINHRAELQARGLPAAEPRVLVTPRVQLPNSGLLTDYYRCQDTLWENDWEDSFDHRDVYAAADFPDTNFYNNVYAFYSGTGDVQRVNWGFCLDDRYINQYESITFAFYRRNGAFNWGCGDSPDWTLVSIPDPTTTVWDDDADDAATVRVIYYYAGTVADKTCVRVWANTFGIGDLMYRDFGAGVAYDEASGVGF